MSKKEFYRRKISSSVMRKAWQIFHSGVQWHYTFSTCLKLAWKLIRGLTRIKYTKLRGVTFPNDTGITRQQLLHRLSKYPSHHISLFFKRDSNNPFDNYAIQVIAHVKDKGYGIIGYLSKKLARKVAPLLDTSKNVMVIFNSITGTNNTAYGCNFSYVVI